MCTFLIRAALLVVPFVPLAAQQPTPAQHSALVAARDAVWRAYFHGDSLGLVAALPERMTGMGKHRDAIIADAIGFRQSGGKLVSVTFTNDEFLVQGDMALVLSNYRVITSHDGKESVMAGKAIEVFTLQSGRWINPYWHLDDQEP
jgi:ketosteroid isomerase-like protein